MSYDITTTPRHKHSYSKITQVNNKPFESMSIISGAVRNERRKKNAGKTLKTSLVILLIKMLID